MRKEIIRLLNNLDAKGVDVSIYTQADKEEENICYLNKSILEKSFFNLQNRIAIHYIQVDNDFILLEFPHTEIYDFRLTWLLDLNNINLKKNVNKNDLIDYFNLLINRAR